MGFLQVQADLWIVTNPQAGNALVPVLTVVAVTLLAAVIFVVPLWGIHRRIGPRKVGAGSQRRHARVADERSARRCR